jgi:hypothetical protein
VQQFSRWILVGASAALALFQPSSAAAASKDAEAQELADQAIFTDYLALDFKAGEKKLQKAIKLCGSDGCSETTQAQLHRDLAVIYITGMKRQDDGRKLLVKALELDPRVALDADLTTPDLIRVFAEAKDDLAQQREEAGGAAAPVPASEPEEPRAKPRATAEPKPKPEAVAEEPAPAVTMDDETVDCPPDFPGCESIEEKQAKAEAEAEEREEKQAIGIPNWLSAGLQQDFLMFSGSSGVCGAERPTELSCYRSGDEFRPGTATNTAGDGGEVAGGFRPATTRLLIGYDRVLFPNISAGIRAGYAIGGGPAEPGGPGFIPIHAELRGTYWFMPFELKKIRPYATIGGGLAQIDSSVTTEVVDRCDDPSTGCSVGQVATSRVTVWKKSGTTFASLGGGAMYPLTNSGGVTAELKGVMLFPSSGISVSLQAGYALGF